MLKIEPNEAGLQFYDDLFDELKKLEKDTNVYVDDLGIEHYPLFMMMFI